MELSEEQFRQLVDEAASLARVTAELNAEWFKQQVTGGNGESSAIHPGLNEKRTSTRIGVRYVVTVRAASKPGAPFRATMFDLSRSGVGLVCPFAVAGQFTLEMPNRDGIIFAVTCTVRSTRPLGANAGSGYAVGATFDDAFGFSAGAAANQPVATPWEAKRGKVA